MKNPLAIVEKGISDWRERELLRKTTSSVPTLLLLNGTGNVTSLMVTLPFLWTQADKKVLALSDMKLLETHPSFPRIVMRYVGGTALMGGENVSLSMKGDFSRFGVRINDQSLLRGGFCWPIFRPGVMNDGEKDIVASDLTVYDVAKAFCDQVEKATGGLILLDLMDVVLAITYLTGGDPSLSSRWQQMIKVSEFSNYLATDPLLVGYVLSTMVVKEPGSEYEGFIQGLYDQKYRSWGQLMMALSKIPTVRVPKGSMVYNTFIAIRTDRAYGGADCIEVPSSVLLQVPGLDFVLGVIRYFKSDQYKDKVQDVILALSKRSLAALGEIEASIVQDTDLYTHTTSRFPEMADIAHQTIDAAIDPMAKSNSLRHLGNVFGIDFDDPDQRNDVASTILDSAAITQAAKTYGEIMKS